MSTRSSTRPLFIAAFILCPPFRLRACSEYLQDITFHRRHCQDCERQTFSFNYPPGRPFNLRQTMSRLKRLFLRSVSPPVLRTVALRGYHPAFKPGAKCAGGHAPSPNGQRHSRGWLYPCRLKHLCGKPPHRGQHSQHHCRRGGGADGGTFQLEGPRHGRRTRDICKPCRRPCMDGYVLALLFSGAVHRKDRTPRGQTSAQAAQEMHSGEYISPPVTRL